MELTQLLDLPSLLVLSIVFFVLYLWQTRSHSLPPGPQGWPIVGCLPQLMGCQDIGAYVLELREKYGDIIYMKIGPARIVYVLGHKLVNEVLTTRSEDFKFRPNWSRQARQFKSHEGILLSNGIHNQRIRKFSLLAMREFGVGKRSLEERIQDEAHILADYLANMKGKPLLLTNMMHRAVANIICGVVFGQRFDYEDKEFLALLTNLDYLVKNNGPQNPSVAFPFLAKIASIFSGENRFQLVGKSFQNLADYLKKQIKHHRLTFDPNSIRDFIDIYLQKEIENKEEDGITEDAIFVATRDLFIAGSETTGTTLMWALLYMIRYPDVQQKCRQQIEQVIGTERKISLKDKANLPYVWAVINEVSRIATILPLSVPHATFKDVELGGYTIPKKTVVRTHLSSVHLDPAHWDRPKEFIPERWINTQGKLIHHKHFYPFAQGPRSCLGEHLAKTELFLFFSTLMQRFYFTARNGDVPTLVGRNTGAIYAPQPYHLCALSNVEEQEQNK